MVSHLKIGRDLPTVGIPHCWCSLLRVRYDVDHHPVRITHEEPAHTGSSVSGCTISCTTPLASSTSETPMEIAESSGAVSSLVTTLTCAVGFSGER